MARDDLFFEQFKAALLKDGWLITDSPLYLRVGRIGYEVDLGAEKLIAAEKGNEQIAVEVKSFQGPSDVNEFHRAMGQYNDYAAALDILEPERELFLAVPVEAWEDFFQEIAIQKALERTRASVIVYNPYTQSIVAWKK